jgi:hypothetical protein
MTNVYFVYTGQSSAEKEVLSEVQPDKVLVSYFYSKSKTLEVMFSELGYFPKDLILDSGAYSAWNKGREISLEKYMKYIEDNKVKKYISLDVINDNGELSRINYEVMRSKGFDPIPVFHIGDELKHLHYYAQTKSLIALGGTAKMRSKPKVREWVKEVISLYPSHSFHLLGSSSKQITDHVNLFSCDSSTWIMNAINGKPKHIKGKTRESKIERAIYNMRKALEENK